MHQRQSQQSGPGKNRRLRQFSTGKNISDSSYRRTQPSPTLTRLSIFFLVSWSLSVANTYVLSGHSNLSIAKADLSDIRCGDIFNESILLKLDRICDNCFNLFREPQLESSCRENCFSTEFFNGCLEAMLTDDEIKEVEGWMKQLRNQDSIDSDSLHNL